MISPKRYEEAIHNSVSKANMIAFLFESWIRCSDVLQEHARLLLSGGFNDRLKMHAMTANGPTRPTVFFLALTRKQIREYFCMFSRQ